MIKIIIVCLLAGLGAGLGTGFAGLSAATVISPVLVGFLGVESYEAIGIALASDVLASAVSAVVYGKNGNLDIRNGIVMMITILIFTMIGSYAASFLPSITMGWMSLAMTFLLGLKFVIKPSNGKRSSLTEASKRKRFFESVGCGVYVGCICGFIGAGGGLMMLFALSIILGYDLKTAVGTSVFIMTFTAFTGSASHFILGSWPDIKILVLCMLFTLIFARIAASIANKASNKTLNRLTGLILILTAGAVFSVEYLI